MFAYTPIRSGVVRSRPLLWAAGFLVVGGLAGAQTDAARQVSFVLRQDLIRQTSAGGQLTEEVVPAPKSVLPGDLLREEVTVRNVSGRALSPVKVSVPVPTGTTFAGTATPAGPRWTLTYSADGGKTYALNPKYAITVTENGQTVTRTVVAPPSAYTNVRWTVSTLKLDEPLKLSFRVKVK